MGISEKLFYFVAFYLVVNMKIYNYFIIYFKNFVMVFKIKIK